MTQAAHMPFTRAHLDWGAYIGAARRVEAFKLARRQAHDQVAPFEKLLSNDILGARCELAGKLYLNPIPWNALGKPRLADGSPLADLSDWIDVKGIRDAHHSLIVQRASPDHWAYFLVDGSAPPDYWLLGWLWGFEAKRPEFWAPDRGFGPAYFVPQNAGLRDPAELLEQVRSRDAGVAA